MYGAWETDNDNENTTTKLEWDRENARNKMKIGLLNAVQAAN